MQKKDSKNTKKIIIMGLDNSGKTSIVMCLKGVKNLSSFSSVTPTRNFEINKFRTLGSTFSIWDFGGQERFREEYLTNFYDHLRGASKLIFVLDVQDRDRYNIALEYLAEIIKLLRKFKIALDFSLFLHKYDPDLDFIKKDINKGMIQFLVNEIEKLIPNDIPYRIFKTSIYTVFQKSAI
jgi:small GTP-binding protein